MRNIAIEYKAKGQADFADLGAPPELKPTEILVATHYSGITNGTERHSLMGEHAWAAMPFPSRHGYQNVGRVEKVGSAVAAFKPGDWVFNGYYVGHRGWIIADAAGAAPNAIGAGLTAKLPDSLDKQHCALMGVAGVAMRGARRVRVSPAQNVWVAGLGLIGQFAAQSARALGAKVTVTDVNPKRLAIAKELGAHCAINMNDSSAWDELKAGGPYEVIIDACGVPPLFLDIHKHNLLSYKGAILAIAVRSETTFHWSTFHGREASIEVSCHFSLDDLKVLLHYMQEGIIRVEPLILNRVPILEAPKIYETMRDRPGDLLGVVFDWSE